MKKFLTGKRIVLIGLVAILAACGGGGGGGGGTTGGDTTTGGTTTTGGNSTTGGTTTVDVKPMVAAGFDHSVAIKSDGSLWAWGMNCGWRDWRDCTAATAVSPLRVGTGNDWVSVAAGNGFTMALKSDGSLWGWGGNSPTRVGTDNDWVSVTSGTTRILAIKSDGSLWAWWGTGSSTSSKTPTRVGSDNDWVSVDVGGTFAPLGEHAFGIKTDGSLWAWGQNDNGQLGLGDTLKRTSPTRVGTDNDWATVSAGSMHTIAIKTDGTLWAWGDNDYMQLGTGISPDGGNGFFHPDIHIPTRVGTDSDWAEVAAGSSTFAVKSNGSLWVWGTVGFDMLGSGAQSYFASPTQVGTDSDWASVDMSSSHVLALKSDGSQWAWGYNNSGQLGLGDREQYPTTLTAIPATPVDNGGTTGGGGTTSGGSTTGGTVDCNSAWLGSSSDVQGSTMCAWACQSYNDGNATQGEATCASLQQIMEDNVGDYCPVCN